MLALLAALPASALAHAVPVSSSPGDGSSGNPAPRDVRVRFSEAVTLLAPTDVEIVDEDGRSAVGGAARVAPDDARAAVTPLRPGLPEGTYTVRYRVVSADSRIVPGVVVFAIGPGPVGLSNLGGGSTRHGPSETGGWAVSARFLELVALGGLLGLLAFRWLVWAPAWRSRWARRVPAEQAAGMLGWGRDVFWVVFGGLAVGSMVAEGSLLVTYSAGALGTTVFQALRDTAGIGDVLATTRLGALMQLRGGLLFGLFAIGAWQFLAESATAAPPAPRPPRARGGRP